MNRFGWILILIGMTGHFWHKNFTKAGEERHENLAVYIEQHWYFWALILIGGIIAFVTSRKKKANNEPPYEKSSDE